MFCCKKSSSFCHDYLGCKDVCCENKTRINRCESMLESYEKLTKPEYMANQDNPLSHAFSLTCEIRKRREENAEVQNELKVLSEKTKKFTVDFLNVCKNSEEVSIVLNFDEDDLTNRKEVEALKNAVNAKHKE
ncbi:short transient receptor potential channel 6, partial [Paramuricea clavata]